jgi:TNF receptor-associated protein 1
MDSKTPGGAAAAEAAMTDKETVTGAADEMTFKAETRQLLDIVACSLYSDKEVFIRELISNASDALEKRRHLEMVNADKWAKEDGDQTPGVSITVNQSKARFVMQDTGVGMNRQELIDNLGTICNSGSKAFIKQLQEKGESSTKTMESIIGQFGVGFYSAFMVAKNIKVYSRSAEKGAKGYLWESDGSGSYKIAECDGVEKGTKIVLEMKDTEVAFCTPQVVERIIKKYSNFISFEINLNGAKINTVQALWMKNKDQVTNEEHVDFYKFISGAYDTPLFKLHYSVDAPLKINSILYVPQSHTEKFGGGRMECAVNLYCRRVLIQSKAKNVIPEWLRFLKGAVDCEDIPLNVSREHTQDGSLMRKLNTIITKRALRWLDEESRKDKVEYERFIKEFGFFLKEGVCTDQINKMDIAKLLRFETSATDASLAMISLDEYIDRMQANQTNVYYLCAPTKEMAMHSPYYEQYRQHNLEVIILTENIDDFVMQHLDTYRKHKLQNIETFDASLDGAVQAQKKLEGDKKDPVVEHQLSEGQCQQLSDFITKRLLGRVGMVKATTRLTTSPVVLVDHESAQMRKLMKMMGQQSGPAPKYNIHFNPKHEIIRKLYTLTQSSNTDETELAGLLSEQLFDNAVIAAGLLEDPRTIVTRLNAMMSKLVEKVPEPPHA